MLKTGSGIRDKLQIKNNHFWYLKSMLEVQQMFDRGMGEVWERFGSGSVEVR